MSSKFTVGVAAAALLLILSGCTGTTGGYTGPVDTPSASEPAPSPAAADAELTTADSSLGEIVVDGTGMTVYMFDKDTQGAGASTCAGQCAANWPAVTTDSTEPVVEGVTGEIGTITGLDGSTQVTLNGWPLYYYVGDAAAGDVNGQGVQDVWWVLTPAGERMAG
ncbi:hypothetical protein ASD65_05015 [Microbacterium sp. Root61]|uniref:COG4315 family predicted lipoprotein n=1 Tax=Microbacterium sp. Root61 TaxID=1736570 RepID=UPI0006FC06E1|nr:hypothetical protein [Microbacterium sp. Root61]KRA23853.1 hypothetical protein ASD65_05015 [Microbacterium sp. Root61]